MDKVPNMLSPRRHLTQQPLRGMAVKACFPGQKRRSWPRMGCPCQERPPKPARDTDKTLNCGMPPARAKETSACPSTWSRSFRLAWAHRVAVAGINLPKTAPKLPHTQAESLKKSDAPAHGANNHKLLDHQGRNTEVSARSQQAKEKTSTELASDAGQRSLNTRGPASAANGQMAGA